MIRFSPCSIGYENDKPADPILSALPPTYANPSTEKSIKMEDREEK
jgi:hypothetical protein